MLDFIADFYQSLTFFQSFFLAFFFCMIVWSTMWGVEASRQNKRARIFENLFHEQKNIFQELSIPFAYKINHASLCISHDFASVVGNDQESILKLVRKKKNFPSWKDFENYVAGQEDSFSEPFEGVNEQIYCLHGRAHAEILFLWISVLKSPHDAHILERKIIDNVPIALWYRNKKLQVNHCNLVYAGALESTKNEVTAEHMELYPAKRSGSPYELTVKALETGRKQIQRIHAVIAGSRRFLEVGVVPFSNGESMGYAFDLTEVENLQQDLQKHIHSQEEIMEHLSTPIAVFGQDTRLVFFNQAYVKMFQFDINWLTSKPNLGDILEDLRSRRKMPEYANFQTHKKERIHIFKTLLQPLQEILHQPDGSILSLFIAPHPQGGMVYIFEDVTEKIVLERQFNTLAAVQKETLDNLLEGIIVFGPDLRVRLLNTAFANIMEIHKRDDFLGKSFQDLMMENFPFLNKDPIVLQKSVLVIFEKRELRETMIQLQNEHWVKYSYIPLPDGSHLISALYVTDMLRFPQSFKTESEVHQHTFPLFEKLAS